MTTPLKMATIGLGGYAYDHIKAVRWLAKDGLAHLVAVVALPSDRQRFPERVAALQNDGVALYDSIEHFLDSGASTADALMCAVGIHQHVPVTIAALRAGLHVFCEKPIAGTVQEVDALIAAQKQAQKEVTIGFQYIPSRSIRELKRRICDGRLGKVKSAKLMCCWPRSEMYYSRNNWAGNLRIDDSWILDSPANNAHAHFLFNLLYLSADQPDRAASSLRLRAELFRANKIASADLVQLKFVADTGTDCFVVLSHCGWQRSGPLMQLVCENGEAIWQGDFGETGIRYSDGQSEYSENDRFDEWRYQIVREFIENIVAGKSSPCPPALARAHTLAINAMHESCPRIHAVADAYIAEVEAIEDYPPQGKALFRKIKDHDAAMQQAFEHGSFFSELGLPWAAGIEAVEVDVRDYSRFPKAATIG